MKHLQESQPRNHASVRWDDAQQNNMEVIALSVADMDFAAPEQVTQAIQERASKGNFCYTYLTPSYYTAITNWFETRYEWEITAQDIIPAGRVVEALPAILHKMTSPQAAVIVPTPAYGPIPAAVRAAGRTVVEWPLINDDKNEFDFTVAADLFAQADALILTNPHNPTGRVWSQQELTRIAKLAEQHGLLVISDEVHADIVLEPHRFTPFLTCAAPTLSAIALLSPGKSFNIAGLEILNIVATNSQTRAQVAQAVAEAGTHNPRFFAQVALEAAYQHGAPWLDELITQVTANGETITKRLAQEVPQIKVHKPQGTYLLWLDCTGLNVTEKELIGSLHNHGLAVSKGSDFGAENYLRINLAVTPQTIEEALHRFVTAIKSLHTK